MSDHQALVEALLMKSILGQELVDTKFHLYSGRSAHSHKVSRLQALSGNDVVLAARSDFFAQLSSRTAPPDATLVDFDGGSAFEDGMTLDDYGYASDSDLEDDEVEDGSQSPVSDGTSTHEGNTSESDDYDYDDDLHIVADGSCKTDSTVGDLMSADPPQAVAPITPAPNRRRLSVVNCRHILVRDTAFRTWKALLLYLYTNKIVFSPLKSQGQPRAHVEGPDTSALWPCSPKSMYRLGRKVRLDSVRDQAFNAIRSGLNAENILQELASPLTSKYPEILQMHVQVLLQHITSVPVIQNLPSLIRRIVDSELPHGGDIIIDLYQKFLLQYHSRALALANAPTQTESAPSQPDGEPGYGRIGPATLPGPLYGSPTPSPPLPRSPSPPSPRYEVPSISPKKKPGEKPGGKPLRKPLKKSAK